MRLPLTLALTAILALGLPAAAAAAELTVSPEKRCYGSGETVEFSGTGFSPGGIVDFTRDGDPIRTRGDRDIRAGSDGVVLARLPLARGRGSKVRTYAAIDRQDPALSDSVDIRVSGLSVDIRPQGGQPSRRRRITAVGFTTGTTLYAHILHEGTVRNLRIGRLRGRCHELDARKRLFGRGAPSGRHTVRFDTKRRYRRTSPAQYFTWRFKIIGQR